MFDSLQAFTYTKDGRQNKKWQLMICTNGLNLNFVVKAEIRQAAVPEGLIDGTAGDYNQAPPSASTAKNTYQ